MARPLRLEMPGGRFHVTLRGNERRPIFRLDTDRYRFLELLGELPERFGTQIHAYVLMDNHLHLMLETPEPNLSRTMQWLGVSYTMWFNTRHRRSGHLFQGRFKAELVEDLRGWQEVARYVHLNPVRVARLGLGKPDRRASRLGVAAAPSPELVGERLRVLRGYPWSSYRGYAGYTKPLVWVSQEPLDSVCGGRSARARRVALRDYTEAPLRQGVLECPWDRVQMGVVLGTAEFAQRIVGGQRGDRREQRELRKSRPAVAWDRIVLAVEGQKGEKWEAFRDRYGDWGRDAVLWLGRRCGRLKLAELGRLAGGLDYAAVSLALRRFGTKLARTPKLQRTLDEIEQQM